MHREIGGFRGGASVPVGSIKDVGQREGIVETEQVQTEPKTSVGFWRQLFLTLAAVQMDHKEQDEQQQQRRRRCRGHRPHLINDMTQSFAAQFKREGRDISFESIVNWFDS